MLPVIDHIASFLINVGITPASEPWRLLEERDLRAARSEINSSSKSAETSADDDDIDGRFEIRDWGLGMKNQFQIPKTRCFTQYFTAIKN